MPRTQRWGRTLAAGAIALGGMTLTDVALGAAPEPAPSCIGGAVSEQRAVNAAIPEAIAGTPDTPGRLTSTITVSGAQGVVRDVDLLTNLFHEEIADLRITLTSPAGRTVTMVEPRFRSRGADMTLDARWDDDAGTPVTDATFPAAGLVPEGAMAAFNGEDPNGNWILTVEDAFAAGADTGTLNTWGLEIGTTAPAPAGRSTSHASGALIDIRNRETVTSDITVSGADPYLLDADLSTLIDHVAPEEIEVRLTSPAGTTAVISTDNGADRDDALFGVTFDDSAAALVTQTNFLAAARPERLVPEGAMGAFIGENPNGVWRLTVTDGPSGGGEGEIEGWSLALTSTAGCTAPVQQPVGAAPGPRPAQPVPVASGAGLTTATPAQPRLVRLRGISAANLTRVGARYRVVARFSAAPRGRVLLQRRVKRGFRTVASAPARGGRAVLFYRPTKAGRQVLRVRFRDASGLKFSRPISVRVRPRAR